MSHDGPRLCKAPVFCAFTLGLLAAPVHTVWFFGLFGFTNQRIAKLRELGEEVDILDRCPPEWPERLLLSALSDQIQHRLAELVDAHRRDLFVGT